MMEELFWIVLQVEIMVVSLFCTSENGVLIQDSFPMSPQYNTLLGIEVPYLYFVKKVSKCDSLQTIENCFFLSQLALSRPLM